MVPLYSKYISRVPRVLEAPHFEKPSKSWTPFAFLESRILLFPALQPEPTLVGYLKGYFVKGGLGFRV